MNVVSIAIGFALFLMGAMGSVVATAQVPYGAIAGIYPPKEKLLKTSQWFDEGQLIIALDRSEEDFTPCKMSWTSVPVSFKNPGNRAETFGGKDYPVLYICFGSDVEKSVFMTFLLELFTSWETKIRAVRLHERLGPNAKRQEISKQGYVRSVTYSPAGMLLQIDFEDHTSQYFSLAELWNAYLLKIYPKRSKPRKAFDWVCSFFLAPERVPLIAAHARTLAADLANGQLKTY